MDEILRAKKLTEEILARAASIQTHMAQVNRSMANMALIEEEHKARGAREAAAAAKPPLRLMDLPDDLLRLIAAWAGVGGGRRWVSYLGSGTSPGPDTHGCGCGASSLAALAITCRRWRRLAAGEPELWKEMCRRRWGITERDAAEVLVLDPRQLHLAAGWPKAALGSAVGGTGGAAAAARTILASVRGAAGAAAAAAGRNGRVEAAGPARRALGTAAAATGSSGAACRSRIPPITASPPRPRGPGQHVSAAAEAGSSSSTGGGGGGGSGGSRRQLLPALASSGSTGLSLQPPLKSPPPSSPSRLPRAFGTMPAGRSPPSLCPGAVAAGPSVLLAPLSIPTSPETSPETSPGFGTFERFGKRTLIQETDGSGRGPGDDATSVPASPTGPQDSQLGAASQALNPPIPRSPPGASDGSLPGPTAAAAAAAATKTAALTRSSVTAAAHAAPRVRGALPATGLGHKGYAAASLASPPSPPPLLPGGDSLEPTPLWCVLQLQGDTGTTSGGGGGGSEGEKARTAAAVTTTTSCVVASASGQEAGSIGPNLWQLVYRDRLVGWRGVLAVFRWLQLHGCPEAVSGSLHRQQLLLALRYLHINIGINEGAGGGGNGAAPTAEAAEATGGGLAAEAVSSHQRLDAQPRVTEALAAELLLAAPDMVPCLLSLLSNDSGLVVELAAAGLADFLALDQARLDQERAAAEANRAAAAAAAAARAGGGGAARDAKARPRLRVRSDEPSIAHLVQLSSNSGRSIAAQLRDGVRSPGIIKQVTRCLINLWATPPVPGVRTLQPARAHTAAPGAACRRPAAIPFLEGGVWQLQEYSARGDPLCLLHTVITFRQPAVASSWVSDAGGGGGGSSSGLHSSSQSWRLPFPPPSQSSLIFPSAPVLPPPPSSSSSSGLGPTHGSLGSHRMTYNGGAGTGTAGGGFSGGGNGANSHRQSLAGERSAVTAAATPTPYPRLPLIGPDGRPLGGRSAALVALGGGTGSRCSGAGGGGSGAASGGPVIELLGGGYEVMLPRHGPDTNLLRASPTATARTDGGGGRFLPFEAEEFRLSGWVDPASGEWCMERHCINVPYALMYKGYSDVHGCWGTYTVQQEPAAAAAAAAAGLQGAHMTTGVASATTATTASTIGPAGSSSIRRLRLFRLFRDPSLEPPKDLQKLLAAMQDHEANIHDTTTVDVDNHQLPPPPPPPQQQQQQQQQTLDQGGGNGGCGDDDTDAMSCEGSDADPDMPHLEPLYG